MLRRGIICVALALYAIVMAAGVVRHARQGGKTVVPPSTGPAVRLPERLPFKGVAMQIQRVDWIDRYKKSLDEIAELGADSVLLIVDARQENGASTKIYMDSRLTPTGERLGELIDHAKGRNLRVLLMPIVLLDNARGDEWRGTIKPEDGSAAGWAAWFESYRSMMSHYAIIAGNHKADLLVVGSELVSSEKHLDEWTATINQVRKYFKGPLTYSSNWDHYMSMPFWDQLDVIGMNAYWSLDKGADGSDKKHNVSSDEIVANWAKIQAEIKAFADKQKKPLLLTEVGWCSMQNAADEPWDYTRTDQFPQDLELQKRLWGSFFKAWKGKDWLAGFMVWAWSPDDGEPQHEKDYSIKGKPAYDVVKAGMAGPWK